MKVQSTHNCPRLLLIAITLALIRSHKRTDSKDFARALYNLLVLRGYSTFLDFEYREELSRLDEIVGRCTNFIFILTDNIFESPWCMKVSWLSNTFQIQNRSL